MLSDPTTNSKTANPEYSRILTNQIDFDNKTINNEVARNLKLVLIGY